MSFEYFTFSTNLVVLIHVIDDPGQLRVVVLDGVRNLERASEVRCLGEFDASQKSSILLNRKIFENLLPDSNETLETAQNKIEVQSSLVKIP